MKRRRALLLSLAFVLALCAACGLWLHATQKQYALNRQLIDAFVNNDTEAALVLVNAGADPDTRLEPLPAPTFQLLCDTLLRHAPPVNDSPTALMLACGRPCIPVRIGPNQFKKAAKENLPLLRAMLARGANVRARTLTDITPLTVAIMAGRVHAVELLLPLGVNVNSREANGQTPLIFAESYGFPDIAHLLLLHGANPNAQDGLGWSSLHNALSTPQAANLIPDLLAHGADPGLRDNEGKTALQTALLSHRIDAARLLKSVTK